MWVSSHREIAGNTKADSLARGVLKPFYGLELYSRLTKNHGTEAKKVEHLLKLKRTTCYWSLVLSLDTALSISSQKNGQDRDRDLDSALQKQKLRTCVVLMHNYVKV